MQVSESFIGSALTWSLMFAGTTAVLLTPQYLCDYRGLAIFGLLILSSLNLVAECCFDYLRATNPQLLAALNVVLLAIAILLLRSIKREEDDKSWQARVELDRKFERELELIKSKVRKFES